MCRRLAPVLKKAIQDGKINLTAIVNTHQYVSVWTQDNARSPKAQHIEEKLT
jgi:hypothetical protein